MAHRLSLILALLVLALAAGCGGSTTNTDSGVDSPVSDTGIVTTVAVTFAEYTITLDDASIPAGTVTFNAINNGVHPHEMVIARTDLTPDMLPTAPDGTVDEAMLDTVDEIGETEAGATGTVTVELTPGSYVLFCNVGDHYSRGMYTTLTVTAP